MRHDATIPAELHSGARESVKDALGMFWSSIFQDQDLVDGLLEARVMSACQAYIDSMEALSLRDHSGMPLLHREHWHPVFVRLSERNTGCALVVGMKDTPQIGPQGEEGSVYLPNEVFDVGGNALYSKVNTYPLKAFDGCRLVSVKTGLFDSISSPRHILSQGRAFDLVGDVLVIRKEHDPFDVDGYRIIEDGDDKIAVMWACDAEFDTDNVRDFLAYPLGFDVDTSRAAARMLSALWDTVVYGLTPRCLNSALGALFDVPVIPRDTMVESVEDDEAAGTTTVVTSDDVYVLPHGSLLPEVKEGTPLRAGDFLVKGITVRHGLSKDEVEALVDDGVLTSVSLPSGSVAGVSTPVVLESMWTDVEDGGWFKLNSGDSAGSPFWSAVRSHASTEDLVRLCEVAKEKSGEHEGKINPVLALGYLVLANTILVESDLPLSQDPCATSVLTCLQRLVPAYASLLAVRRIAVGDDVPLIPAYTVSYSIDGRPSVPVEPAPVGPSPLFRVSGLAAGNHVCSVTVSVTGADASVTVPVVFVAAPGGQGVPGSAPGTVDGWGASPLDPAGAAVRTDGTLRYAYAHGTHVVNGVQFAGVGDSLINTPNCVVWEATPGAHSATPTPPSDVTDSAYRGLLEHCWWASGKGRKIQMNNLEPGKRYLVQIITFNQTYTTQSATAPDGTTTVKFGGTGWEYGSSLVGVFTAGGTSEEFTIMYSGNACINAIQVRELPSAGALVLGRVAVAVAVAADGDAAEVSLEGVAVESDRVQTGFTVEADAVSDAGGRASDNVAYVMVPIAETEV